jgi:polar amino acid transport system permease protein
MMDWSWSFAFDILPDLLKGLLITVEATLLAFPIALAMGLGLEMARRSSPRCATAVSLLTQFIRGTPLLVQLYVIFYILPDVGIVLPPLTAGVMGLAIHYSAYNAEVFRAGIESVPVGQWEAARVCNLTRWQTWRHVVVPQAVRPMVPSFANYLIAMFKETPLLSAIAVLDLMGEARSISNYYYRYAEPIVLVGALFLIISLAASGAVRQLERYLQLTRRDASNLAPAPASV